MNKKRTSILSDLERNYNDTKSISKSVDLSALENKVNPHKIYNNIFKNVDDTPSDYPTEKMSVGDVVFMNNNPNIQFEIISITDKNNITVKNLSNNETLNTSQDNIKKIMENIDMAKKKINETQYSVSINGLETTDANALSQMMSAAAQADSGNADVGGIDMTSTPELPTPENTIETLPQDEEISLDNDANAYANPEIDTAVVPTDSIEDADFDTVEDEDSIEGIDNELPSNVENPLNNPESEIDSFEDDFDMDMDEPVVDDIEFDEEIEPTDDEVEIDDMEITESQLNESRPDKEDFDDIDENVLQELYEIICEQMGDDYLSDYDEVDYMEFLDCIKDFGNDIEGFDDSLAEKYATALKSKWKEEHIDDGSDYEDYDRPNWGDDEDEEINEDILLPKATEDETFNASQKLKDDEDEESERISESMDALIKSILENADAKSEQEIYAEEISEDADTNKFDEAYDEAYDIWNNAGSYEDDLMKVCSDVADKYGVDADELYKKIQDAESFDENDEDDEEILDEDNDEFDVEISEALRNAGVKLEEATVKPTIVTDESSFANKPNKALKPEDKKTVEKKTVDTATFGKDASEGFKEPLNCIKCEAVSPKEKIKAIYETAKVRYSKANKDEWNALDRRYIKKLIENGCGYTRASKIILEAKKQK